MQRDTPGAAAHVEDPATDLPHGSPLMGGPPLEWGKVAWGSCRNAEPAVVTFDDLGRGQAPVVSVYKAAACVAGQGQHFVLIVAD